MNTQENDEIDLFSLIETLWQGRWKIVLTTFLCSTIGVIYTLLTPNSFKVTTPIQAGKPSVFINYTAINDVLKENNLLLTDKNLNGYLIDSPSIFKIFLSEFNDYEEMIKVLSKNEYIISLIKDLDKDKKRRTLIEYAKLFKINKLPKIREVKTKDEWMLSFGWHDALEGSSLFDEALLLTLKNTKNTLLNDINSLASTIDMKNSRKIEEQTIQLDLIKKTRLINITKRLAFLKEQSAIAKELQIQENKLDRNTLISVTDDFPYYLRGYLAIEKEIDLINNRSQNEQLLMAKGYVQNQKKLLEFQNDSSASQLRSALKIIENDNPNTWVEFNLAFADSVSQKRSLLYLALSIMIGGVLGSFYVITSKSFQNRKNYLQQ